MLKKNNNVTNYNILVDLNALASDMGELIFQNKFTHEELWEYDEVNNIYIYREDKQKLLEETVEELKLFITKNHIIE
jgi:hypothetical protein